MDAIPDEIWEAARSLRNAVNWQSNASVEPIARALYERDKRAAAILAAEEQRVFAAAHRAQADALEIEAAAKRRLADEYGQRRGEIAKGSVRADIVPAENDVRPATAAEVGIDRKEIHDARQMRDAIASNPTIVRDALDQILKDGDEPTRAALRKAIAPSVKAVRADVQAEKKERRGERETTLAEKIKALPGKRYGLILADPEWRFEPYSRDSGMDRSADNHYPTSELEDIKARDVASIAADDCVLFLWATAPMLPQALAVMDAWGFAYKTHAIWFKQRPGEGRGTGYWFLGEHELLLVGTRGDVVAPAMGSQFRSVFQAPVRAHSEKPDASFEIIESYFPNLPKIELNRRGPARDGWDSWGAEAVESEAA